MTSDLFYSPFYYTADKQYSNDSKFRKFRRQLFHSSLARVLESLKPGMTKPEVVRCADDHFRRVIYGLGPYIADYPEQALLACIVQGWCAKFVSLLQLILRFIITHYDISLDALRHHAILMVASRHAVFVDTQNYWLRS
jgi:Plavaka transposase